MQSLLKHIATLGPVGYIPFGPGTWGSLVASFCLWFFPLSTPLHILSIIIGALVGSVAATAAEIQFRQKDCQKIVIDEFIGCYLAAFHIPHSITLLIAAFILFRFFDIFKPLGIRNLEKALRSGKGIMADDILAGTYANAALQIWLLLNA